MVCIASPEMNLGFYLRMLFPEHGIFTPCLSGQVATKQKVLPKINKFFLKAIQSKTFSIRKQLFDMLDVELEFTRSEI